MRGGPQGKRTFKICMDECGTGRPKNKICVDECGTGRPKKKIGRDFFCLDEIN